MLDRYKKFYQEIYCTITDPKNDYKTERFIPKISRDGKWVDMDLTNPYEVDNFKKYMKEKHNLIVTIRTERRASVLTKIIWFIEDLLHAIKETIEEILPYV